MIPMRPRGHPLRRREPMSRVTFTLGLAFVLTCSACGLQLQPNGTLERGFFPIPSARLFIYGALLATGIIILVATRRCR